LFSSSTHIGHVSEDILNHFSGARETCLGIVSIYCRGGEEKQLAYSSFIHSTLIL